RGRRGGAPRPDSDMRRFPHTIAFLIAGLLAAGAAQAQDAQRADALERLAACRAVADGAARLACYDAAAAALDEAERAGDVVVLDRAQVEETRRGLFGFPMPNLDIFSRGDGPVEAPEIDNVSYVVAQARQADRNVWVFTMEDGSVWRQIDGRMWGRPRAGEAAVVRRAALGSYMMNVGDAPAIRVRREQ
ncbi:hypothetical protein, partial [Brevundimonas sp.]|uniref:hypothetical protein n=1 Tax=Brevundimonas sp. TaxID=1871086 RepID=UPI0025F9C480